MTAIHVCNAPGCARHAIKPCFDCGQWRCEEHLVAAVHHRKSAVVHLCPSCMRAHAENPEALRIHGVEDERAQRASDPLARRQTRLDAITPLENNPLLSEIARAHTEALWQLETARARHSSKRVTKGFALVPEHR